MLPRHYAHHQQGVVAPQPPTSADIRGQQRVAAAPSPKREEIYGQQRAAAAPSPKRAEIYGQQRAAAAPSPKRAEIYGQQRVAAAPSPKREEIYGQQRVAAAPSPKREEIHGRQRVDPFAAAPPPNPARIPNNVEDIVKGIQAESTPNEKAVLLYLPVGMEFDIAAGISLPLRYGDGKPADGSPLAICLLKIGGVVGVAIGKTYCTVTFQGSFDRVSPYVKRAMAEHVLKGSPPAVAYVLKARGICQDSDSDSDSLPPYA